ncbi:hypothetical protein [Actinosynnema mirum]|nr:hypothetical protein [Actinosynnema mirum]AXX29346.1 hypothetical protein APASM_1981 [Actinosynnema pretiosum subsp. pretiosum]
MTGNSACCTWRSLRSGRWPSSRLATRPDLDYASGVVLVTG